MERLGKAGMMGENLLSASRKRIQGEYVPHAHDFYEIEYILAGEGTASVNGKEERCLPGTLCFLTPIDCHSVRSGGAEVFNVMFSEQLVDYELLAPFSRWDVTKTLDIPPEERPLVELLLGEMVTHEQDTGYCALVMSCLLGKLARLMPRNAAGPLGSMLSRVQAYLINHFREKVTLNTLANHVGLTPGYVSALFRKEMGIGFKAYLNTLRLEYAKKLLISTQLTVRQICEESGFEDVPNFIRRFKAYHGVTPTTLRRVNQERWE